jgi:uncharacterized membrane protein
MGFFQNFQFFLFVKRISNPVLVSNWNWVVIFSLANFIQKQHPGALVSEGWR